LIFVLRGPPNQRRIKVKGRLGDKSKGGSEDFSHVNELFLMRTMPASN
jgi:hypothetical protein